MEKYDEVLVQVEFNNIVVKIKDPFVAEQVKGLLIGKKPKTKHGFKMHNWSKEDDEFLAKAIAEGKGRFNKSQLYKQVAQVLGVTTSAVASRVHKFKLFDEAVTREEFTI